MIKKKTVIFLILFLLASLSGISQLVVDGESNFTIMMPEHPTVVENKAVDIFRKYFKLATNFELPLYRPKSSKPLSVISIGQTTDQRVSKSMLADIEHDGFIIFFSTNYISIVGSSDRGTLNGVYAFIERYLGVYYLAPGVITKIAVRKNITIPQNAFISSNPAFKWRDIFSTAAYDPTFSEWHGLSHMYTEPTIWGNTDHTFFKLVPPADYFKVYPQFYSLIEGKRVPSQLCLSNSQLRDVIVKKLQKEITLKPEKSIWMVGQEDFGQFCGCKYCKELYTTYGGYSGAILSFVNKIAAFFPKKIIATFAYHETLVPPNKKIKPLSNVLIVYAPIEAFKQNGYTGSTDNSIFVNYLQEWNSISNNLMVWEYISSYQNMFKPYPIIHMLSSNFKLFKKYGVDYVYAEGVMKQGEHLGALKTYVAAKLLWNPYLNSDSLVKSFCDLYYGKASKYILQYLNVLEENVIHNNDQLRFWGGSEKYLSQAYLYQYDLILEKAAETVRGQTIYLDRVNEVRLSIDFLLELDSKKQETLNTKISRQISSRVNRILTTAKKEKIDWIIHNGEWKQLHKFFEP